MTAPQRTNLKVIVNCGPCQAYIGKSLASLRTQTYARWEAYVTVDLCGDKTLEEAIRGKGRDNRIRITQNESRLYSTANLVRAIERSRAGPELDDERWHKGVWGWNGCFQGWQPDECSGGGDIEVGRGRDEGEIKMTNDQ